MAILIPATYYYPYAEESFRFLKELVISLNNGAPMDLDGSAK